MNRKKGLRVAVVGVGQMGRHHARVYSQLRGVDLVGVVDINPKWLQESSTLYQCQGFDAIGSLVGQVDAVSIATPPGTHAAIGQFLMNHGIHCLIEKPLAVSEKECQLLIDTAAANHITLLVGHIERFNPAVQELAALVSQGLRIFAIDARRMSHSSARITDVDVIADLMIHDLDIVMALVNRPVARVVASSVHIPESQGVDHVAALLNFDNGAMSSLTASRITQGRIREMHCNTDLGWISVHFISQELSLVRQGSFRAGEPHDPPNLKYNVDLSVEKIAVKRAEPLVLEIQHFVDAVLNRTSPLVTGSQALEVFKVSQKIRQSAIARDMSPCGQTVMDGN
ncbi:MAG: Gfo/Idh/MocA family oxidoreductase [Magnetococcales bacterium]|nr:Gfo/Idh/MocA family oxidoreductase [Magnetococcales bacterium]